MKGFLLILSIWFINTRTFSQQRDSLILRDSSGSSAIVIKDSSIHKHSPRRATLRSAIIPGWGQVYNKKYWKVPLVYAAIGIPAYFFLDNKKWYERTRAAAKMISNNDTSDYRNRVNQKLHVFFTNPNALGALINYRNEFRRNMDYSILFFLLAWGLNIVDATVDGHLKDFDVSEDLSLKIKPTFIPGSNSPGISVVLTFGKNHSKNISSPY